jgi:hypothetical protein
MTRWAARRDTNEPELVEAARQIGLKVFYLREVGDLLVQFGPLTELWEVKTEAGKLTDAQCRMRQAGLKARLVKTVDDVLRAKKEMTGAILAMVKAAA